MIASSCTAGRAIVHLLKGPAGDVHVGFAVFGHPVQFASAEPGHALESVGCFAAAERRAGNRIQKVMYLGWVSTVLWQKSRLPGE